MLRVMKPPGGLRFPVSRNPPPYRSLPDRGMKQSRTLDPARPYIGKMRVLLFDIDGTLIRSGGAGKAAMEAGLRKRLEFENSGTRVPYSGRTDTGITRDLLAMHGSSRRMPTSSGCRRPICLAFPTCSVNVRAMSCRG